MPAIMERGTKYVLVMNTERQDYRVQIAYQKDNSSDWFVPGRDDGEEYQLLPDKNIDGFLKTIITWEDIKGPEFKPDDLITTRDDSDEVTNAWTIKQTFFNPVIKDYYYQCERKAANGEHVSQTIFEKNVVLVKEDVSDQIDLSEEFTVRKAQG